MHLYQELQQSINSVKDHIFNLPFTTKFKLSCKTMLPGSLSRRWVSYNMANEIKSLERFVKWDQKRRLGKRTLMILRGRLLFAINSRWWIRSIRVRVLEREGEDPPTDDQENTLSSVEFLDDYGPVRLYVLYRCSMLSFSYLWAITYFPKSFCLTNLPR